MNKTLMSLATLISATSVSLAKDAVDAAAPATAAYGMSLKQAWDYGGWIMWVLAFLSVCALSLVFYFIWALRTNAIIPHELVSDVLSRIRAGDLTETRRLTERTPCAFSAVVLSSLDCLRNVPDCDAAMLRSMAESEGSRQAESIQGQTEWLLDISTIAPLLGLLGTVLGMLTAFGSVASDIASAKPVVLAAGVSQAIVTTVFGLIVAIPCIAFYAGFRRHASKQISNLEAVSAEVVTALITVEHSK
jgi:biopolymer transport protein ExbB